MALPVDEVIPQYNFLHPQIADSSQCTSSSNVSYLLCGICHNLWNTTFGDRKEFNKYRKVLMSQDEKGTIEGISYRSTLVPGIKVYIPPKIKKVAFFRGQWNLQQGCAALILPGEKEITILKVPLSTNNHHLLSVKAIPKNDEELSENNFILVPELFNFLQGIYSRADFLRWVAAHVARGAPAVDHFKVGEPTPPTSSERVNISDYGKLYHEVKRSEKEFNVKKKQLKQLELEVEHQAQKYGDHEKSLRLNEHQLLVSIKRKEGTPNPITEKYIQEMLPYALLKSGILTSDNYTRLTPAVWERVVKILYAPEVRGRRPTSRSLIVKPLSVQQNTIEI